MSQTIQISDKSAALLAQQAAAHGKSLEAWVEELAVEKAQSTGTTRQSKIRAATEGGLELQHVKPDPAGPSLVEQMREIRSHVKPDPDGWTVKDYINYGRR